MEFNQPVFKAPSIPKLGKQTVASSVIRGAIKPQIKLKKSTFSFIKPVQSSVDTEKISQPIVNQGIIVEKELVGTNKILTEIKNLLSFDFGYRITEEKKELAAEKKRISAAKVADKEARIEKGGKGILGKTFDKVVAPFKSIFQKLIDFFSIILTGIFLNSAFEWLKDKNNQKKLTEFFDFLKEYWQELLIIFAAYKLAKLVGVVAGIALKLRKLIKWFKNLKSPIKPPTKPTLPGGKPISPPPKSPLEKGPGQSPQPRPQPPRPILGPTGKPAVTDPLSRYKGPGSAPARAPGIPKPGTGIKPPVVTPQPKGKMDFSKFSGGGLRMAGKFLRMIGLAFLADEISKDYQKGDYKAIAVKLSAYGLGWLTTSVLATGGLAAAGTGVGTVPGVAIVGSSVLAGAGVDAGVRKAFGYSEGGTVGKGDRPGRDTVPAFVRGGNKILLDPEEEVTRASEARRWRPLLKDVNNNGARLWAAFSQGVKDQTFANRDQLELNRNLGDVVKEFKDFVDSEIKKSKQKNRPKGNPRPTPPTPPTQPRTGSGSSGGAGAISSPPPQPPQKINPISNQIVDNIWNRPAGTTAAMQRQQQSGAMDPGGTPAQPPSSGPQQLPVTSASTSDDLSKMGIEQLKRILDPTKNARSVPGLFNHISGVREQNKNLSGSALERKVLEETVRFIRNANLQSVLPNREGLIRKSNPQEGQTAFINLPPDKSILPPPPKPSGQVKSKSATAVPQISGSKPYYSEIARLYGIESHPAFS